jgi:hypothetical protein
MSFNFVNIAEAAFLLADFFDEPLPYSLSFSQERVHHLLLCRETQRVWQWLVEKVGQKKCRLGNVDEIEGHTSRLKRAYCRQRRF